MTITQMECFVEATKTLNFTKAAENLYISQQVMSRQIKALENELGFPVFERLNLGVRLTLAGAALSLEWRGLLERYRSSVDRAADIYFGEQKHLRIGVSDMGSLVPKVSRMLLSFNEKYPDLTVEYEVESYPRMRGEIEDGSLDLLITFGVEVLQETGWSKINIRHSGFRAGFILSKHHPLAHKKTLSYQDLQYETIGVLSPHLSIDHRERIRNLFLENGVYNPLTLKEYDTYTNLQIALATGKCVGAFYEYIMDGMEDKLLFYPTEKQEHEGSDIVVAWKKDKFRVKAANIAHLLEEQIFDRC